VHGDLGIRVAAPQVVAEPRSARGGQVVQADLLERETGAGQEGVDVAGDQTHPEEPTRVGAAGRAEPVRRQRRRRRRAVALMIELSSTANG